MAHLNFALKINVFGKAQKPRWRLVFACLLLLSFGLSFLINILTHGAVFSAYYFSELDSGMDFFNSMIYTVGRTPYLVYGTLYPPLANLIYYLLQNCVPREQVATWPDISWEKMYEHRGQEMDLRVHSSSLMLFILFTLLVVLGLFFLVYRMVQQRTSHPGLVALSFLLTTGMIFSLDRGNIVILSVLCSLFFVCFWQDDRWWMRELALLALAFSAGLKLYPALLGVLLLQAREWKRALRAVLYGVLSFFLPFFAFHGVDSIRKFFQALLRFNQYDPTTAPCGLSSLQISNALMSLADVYDRTAGFQAARIFAYAALIVGVVLCCFWKNRWKSVALLSLLMIVVPGQSMNYTLLNLLLPAALLFAGSDQETGRWRNFYLVIFFFAFAILPWQFIVLPARVYTLTTANLAVQIAVLVLVCTLLLDGLTEQLLRFRERRAK